MQSHYATQSAMLGVHADGVRTETLHGREHVVAPVTLVREMVLKGEFLPLDEIEATQLAWNAKPATITHPRNDAGDFVPASAPGQYETHATGTMFGVETSTASRALEGEVWIDRDRSATVADELDRDDPAEMLLDDDTVEVSVGYWYQRFEADGEHDGTEFDAVQVGVQPDHLALLPNGTGECSIEDGCGAGRDDANAGVAMSGSASGSASASASAPGTTSTPSLSILQRGRARLESLGIGFGAACDCGTGTGTGTGTTGAERTDSNSDTTMNDRIRQLAESSAFDVETLENWDDAQLDALEETIAPDDPDGGDSGGDAGDATTGAQNQNQNQNQTPASTSDAALTRDDVQSIVREALEADRKERTADQRRDLVDDITAHTSMTEDALDGMDVDALEALAAEISPTPTGGVYAGRTGGASASNTNGDASDIPVGLGDRYLEADN